MSQLLNQENATESELLERYSGMFDHLDSCCGITLDLEDIMVSGAFTEDEENRVIVLRK